MPHALQTAEVLVRVSHLCRELCGLHYGFDWFWRTPFFGRGRQNLLFDTFASQRRQHVSERWMTLGGVPRAIRRTIVTMTTAGEPQDDQAGQQHRGRRGSLHRAARPALRLFEAQVRLAVLEGHLDRPAHGIPGENLPRWRVE